MKGVFMKKRIVAVICSAMMLVVSGCSGKNSESDKKTTTTKVTAPEIKVDVTLTDEEIIDSLNNGIVIDEVSGNVYKTDRNANPISGSIFCADPTSVEYNGRLYVYGTNDTQQSEQDTVNDYDQIKSLVVFSTDDMVNWIYHGRIETGEIAPWIYNSWAPSIVSRVE
ncbi:MAG: beta-xylosidase, partial [Oscillospiraceae bacterium]|nr:beta-xylosidase [Oscillospiraceae bacterium]